MIQDIGKHCYHNEYHPVKPDEKDYLIGVCGQELYMTEQDGQLEYLSFSQLDPALRERLVCSAEEESEEGKLYVVYLFQIDEKACYLADPQKASYPELLEELRKIKGIRAVQMQEFRRLQPMWKAFLGITAMQLHGWYQNRKFCGHCGSSLQKSRKERAMVCPECGLIEYPKICPAVIIAVTNGDKLMMTRYAGRPEVKNYALVAGFTEIGESFEDTVRREVMEEVGLNVKNITYYKSQPWSFTDTILAGFYCQLDGSEEYHMDTEELASAEWIAREDLPTYTETISLTSEMIMAFKNGSYPEYDSWEEQQVPIK